MREMKDSGVAWIGEIPVEWSVCRIAYYTKFINGYAFQSSELNNDNGYVVIRIGNVTSQGLNIDNALRYNGNIHNLLSYQIKNNDIIIAMSGATTGKNCLIRNCKDVFMINQRVGIIRSNEDIRFISYILNCNGFSCYIDLLSAGSAQPNISGKNILNFKFSEPPLETQHRIADYLDNKCSQIDAIIQREQAVIEKLKEYKLSVITEAVTKGLDPNVEMKDSGIEWIGKIPKNWNCIISRFLLDKVGDIDHYMPDSIDSGVPYLMIGDLKEATSKIDFVNCKQISLEDFEELRKKIQPHKGDVIFARYATIGTVCYVDTNNDFLVSYACVTARPNKKKLDGHYLFYFFKSVAFLEDVKQYINANTQGNVGIEALYKTKITLPSIKEQGTIVEFLEHKCSEIDKAIENKQSVINKLTEYKKSLIYEVVTGKKEI